MVRVRLELLMFSDEIFPEIYFKVYLNIGTFILN